MVNFWQVQATRIEC